MTYYCPNCSNELIEAVGASFDLECPVCETKYNIEDDTDNGIPVAAEVDDYFESKNDDIPEGCIACGGPYPDCMTSCKIFDD